MVIVKKSKSKDKEELIGMGRNFYRSKIFR